MSAALRRVRQRHGRDENFGLTSLDLLYARYGTSRSDTQHVLSPSKVYEMPQDLVELKNKLPKLEDYVKSCQSQYN